MRIVHSGAVRAQRGWHERRTDVDHRRADGGHRRPRTIFLGSKLARDLWTLPGKDYEEVYKSYGPRSYLYAEMVFGNTFNVRNVIASMPQTSIWRCGRRARFR